MNLSSSPTWINILSSNSISSLYCTIPSAAPTKLHKPINHSMFPITHGLINSDQTSSAPIVPNFGNPNHLESLQQVNPLSLNHEGQGVVSQGFAIQGSDKMIFQNAMQRSQLKKKKQRTRLPSQVYDHIIAERRRREQISQLFIVLSAIVPGLKKTDKNSILGDTIKYMKYLHQRVETLEEKAAEHTMDPVEVVKKSKIVVEDEQSSDERGGSSDERADLALEIEVKVVNNNILLKIRCGKQKGILANLLRKVESLNMVVLNTNVIPFGSSELDISIIAQMEKELSLTVKEVATALRAAILSGAA